MPAKKKTTAKKRPAPTRAPARKPAARRATRRGHAGSTGVPESLLRLAEETAAREEEAKAAAKRGQDPDAGSTVSLEEPAERLAELSAASQPGALVTERIRRLDEDDAFDTVAGFEEPAMRSAVAVARPIEAPAKQVRPSAMIGSSTVSGPSGEAVIDVEDLHVFYGAVEALRGISFRVYAGETVAIIGSNGAGKTTTLKTVSGVSELLKNVRGRINILGSRVESWPAHKIARLGVAHSPEGRKIFPNQSVRDNLMLGAFGRGDGDIDSDIIRMEERFPILGQRRHQAAGLMSGGEQQMLAMARALMARPKVILFDEPSMGLAPLIVKQIFEIIAELKSEGKTILLVEQMAFQALGIADRGYVLETGSITMEGTGASLLEDPRVKEAYLGA